MTAARCKAHRRGSHVDHVAVVDEAVSTPLSRRARLMGATALAGGALRGLVLVTGLAATVPMLVPSPAAAQICGLSPNGAEPQDGFGAVVSGGAMACGNSANANGIFATATGFFSKANGSSASAYGASSNALGTDATATGVGANAIGTDATATGQNSNAFGVNATATGDSSLAFGGAATATGQFSRANGENATATGQGSFANGTQATATGAFSLVLPFVRK